MGDSRGVGSRIFTGSGTQGDNWRQPVRVRDNANAAKPLGAVNIDGVTPLVNGDRVLFTALAGGELVDNNKVFRAVVAAGLVTSWNLDTDGQSPDGSPKDGNIIYVKEGTTYGDKMFKWTGSGWSEVGSGGGAGANQQLSNLVAAVTPNQPFLHLAGSAGTPSYSFASATGTGFFLSAADSIGISTAGIFRGSIGATGTLTLGTTITTGLRLQLNVQSGQYAGFTSTGGSASYFSLSNGIGGAFIGTEGSGGTGLFGGGFGNALAIGTTTAHPVVFHTNNALTPRLIIDSTLITHNVVSLVPAGTGANPSIGFIGDPDSGIYQASGANTVALATGGGARWEVFNSGHFRPFLDNTNDLGDTTHWVRDSYVRRAMIMTGATDYAIRGTAQTVPTGDSAIFSMGSIGGANGNIALFTGDSSTGAGQLFIATGNASGAAVASTASIKYYTGNHTNAANTTTTGSHIFTTGNNSGTGAANSGGFSFTSGTVVGGTRGDFTVNVRLVTLTTTNGVSVTGNMVPSAAVTYNLGSPSQAYNILYTRFVLGRAADFTVGSDFNTGFQCQIQSGHSNTAANTGVLNVFSGDILSVGTGTPGAATFRGGDILEATNNNNTSLVTVRSGNTAGGGNSGDLLFSPGTVTTGVRGKIRLADASLSGASVGYVWTLTNTTTGAGQWSAAGGGGGPTWTKYTVSHLALQAVALTNDIELFSLPAKTVIQGVVISHTTQFSGGAISAYTLSVGIASNLTKYASPFDVFQGTGDNVAQTSQSLDFESKTAATSIRLAALSTGANLNASTQGDVEIWVLTSTLS